MVEDFLSAGGVQRKLVRLIAVQYVDTRWIPLSAGTHFCRRSANLDDRARRIVVMLASIANRNNDSYLRESSARARWAEGGKSHAGLSAIHSTIRRIFVRVVNYIPSLRDLDLICPFPGLDGVG